MSKKKIALLAGGALAGGLCLADIKDIRVKAYTPVNDQTVLITGASGGLGRELAEVFAMNQCEHIVVAARSENKLATLKQELERCYGVGVTAITADLSEKGGARKLYDQVKELGIEVDQLINNAGVGKESRVVDCEPDTLSDIITLNVESVTLLCRLFGADMAERGSGKIMNVSSLGAFIPDPYFNVYGPSKAYELYLTLAMHGELHKTGVTVTALCPGPMKTNWAANAGKANSKTARDPRDIAEEGFRAMQRGELVSIPGRLYGAEKAAMKFLPYNLQVSIIRKWQSSLIKKSRKQD